jgi:hypothetical protein
LHTHLLFHRTITIPCDHSNVKHTYDLTFFFFFFFYLNGYYIFLAIKRQIYSNARTSETGHRSFALAILESPRSSARLKLIFFPKLGDEKRRQVRLNLLGFTENVCDVFRCSIVPEGGQFFDRVLGVVLIAINRKLSPKV